MRRAATFAIVVLFSLGAFAGCIGGTKTNPADAVSSFQIEDFTTDTSIPKPEHPRPDFQRSKWMNLNGQWGFEFDPANTGETEQWFVPGKHKFSQQITVPFCWESPASGLEPYFRGEYPQYYALQNPTYTGTAWYQRTVNVPEEWKDSHVLLKFGAVDWESKVWINENLVGQHVGGYSAFEFDITQYIAAGQDFTLTVKATDPSDTNPEIPRGKQGGIWYTRCSGIWQTAYMETCPEERITGIYVFPDVDNSSVSFEIVHSGGAEVRVSAKSPDNRIFTANEKICSGKTKVALKLEKQMLWSPDEPNLYDAVVELVGKSGAVDSVKTYFGQRKIEAKWAPGHSPQDTQDVKEQYKYIYLNDKPIYLRGLLDQSYNPWGIYTYVNESDLKYDIQKMKDYGFNFLRIHIKADEPRRLYWADKLGMLIMKDVPCSDAAPNYPGAQSRAYFEQTMRDMIERDFNHPSIFSWCIFNENWGLLLPVPLYANPEMQSWVVSMVEKAKALDPTRLVEDNSAIVYNYDNAHTPAGGWHTSTTDIFSWHFYINDYAVAKKHLNNVVDNAYAGSTWGCVPGAVQDADPLMNSEYGGIACTDGNKDVSWCFKYLTNEMRLHPKICGFVYTEVTDVEWEHNGILRYDRSPKDFGYETFGCALSDFTGADFLALDNPPGERLALGGQVTANPHFSKYSDSEARSGDLKWTLTATNSLGEKMGKLASGSVPVNFGQYTVTKLPEIKVTLPGETCLATLLIWLESDGKIMGRNYLNYHVYIPAESVSKQGTKTIVRFDPTSYSNASWNEAGPTASNQMVPGVSTPLMAPSYATSNPMGGSGAVWGYDSGYFEYSVPVPAGLSLQSVKSIILLLEASGAYGDFNYQTDASRHQSEMKVKINGVDAGGVLLPDAPSDARGVLSYLDSPQVLLNAGAAVKQGIPLYGSYGCKVQVKVDGAKLGEIMKSALGSGSLTLRLEVGGEPAYCNGLRIYSESNGAYPMNPTIIFE